MKISWKLRVIALLLAGSGFAYADTIQLGSFATGAGSLGDANTAMNYAGFNSGSPTPSVGTGTTYTLAPGTLWAGPTANSTWVGFAPTAGPVGTVNPDYGYYTFTTTFTALSSNPYSGSLSVMADDSAQVYLNGTLLVSFGTLGGDGHCADGMPDCLSTDIVPLSGLSLLSGVDANTLTFVVQQAGFGPPGGTGDPTGVDFGATLSSGSPIPEPSTLLLLGTGLIGLSALCGRMQPLVMSAPQSRGAEAN
jgi:hypothetical protein